MQTWVDMKACPKSISDMLFLLVVRTRFIILAANRYLKTHQSGYSECLQAKIGEDMADNEIVKQPNVGDLLITTDWYLKKTTLIVDLIKTQ